jgi:ATP-binding protein involved in chromosome partitioning
MQPQLTEKMVYDALSEVMDPELHHSVVELGFVRDIDIAGDWVRIDIQLTTPHCPFADSIVAGMKDAVARIPGVNDVEIQRVCEQEA